MFSNKKQTAKLLVFGIGLAFVFFTTLLHLRNGQMATKLMVGLEFEVYGRVQGELSPYYWKLIISLT